MTKQTRLYTAGMPRQGAGRRMVFSPGGIWAQGPAVRDVLPIPGSEIGSCCWERGAFTIDEMRRCDAYDTDMNDNDMI